MKTIVLLFGSVMLLQGCVYPISKDLVEKMDKTITFEMLQADPDLYRGRFVIVGRSISAITGLVEGSLIHIYQTPFIKTSLLSKIGFEKKSGLSKIVVANN